MRSEARRKRQVIWGRRLGRRVRPSRARLRKLERLLKVGGVRKENMKYILKFKG
jgi:hypothetical protein